MFKRTPWVLAVAFAVSAASGCGLFSDDPEDDPTDIIIKDSVPVDFVLSDSELCQGVDCSGEPMPSPAAVDLPAFEVPAPIDIIEATDNQELAEVAGRLKRVEVESIDYVIGPNTLNVAGPELDIHMAPLDVTASDGEGAFFFATLPSAEAMTEAEGNVPVDQAAQDQMSELLKELKFTIIAGGDKDIAEGELFPPRGETEYTLTFNLKFTANAIDQFQQ